MHKFGSCLSICRKKYRLLTLFMQTKYRQAFESVFFWRCLKNVSSDENSPLKPINRNQPEDRGWVEIMKLPTSSCRLSSFCSAKYANSLYEPTLSAALSAYKIMPSSAVSSILTSIPQVVWISRLNFIASEIFKVKSSSQACIACSYVA